MIKEDYARTLFDFLYGPIDGYKTSSTARRDSGEDCKDLLYGEMPFDTWMAIVAAAKPKENAVFFDLGSGVGRAIIQSHLLFDFKKSVGVELLDGLHNKALEVFDHFKKIVEPQVAKSLKNKEVVFLKDNILQVDLSEADFVYMCHPFKNEQEFLALEQRFLSQLKKGTKIVTIIRQLRNEGFKKLGSTMFDFSWGKSTAYFHEI
jgi:hypothetical protein